MNALRARLERWRQALWARREAVVELALWLGLPLGAFWVWTRAMDLADWDFGGERLLAAGVGVAGAWSLARLGPASAAVRPAWLQGRRLVAWLALVGAGAVVVHGVEMVRVVESRRAPYADIGATTVKAVEVAALGKSPYREFIDPIGARVEPRGKGFRFFGGFKYGPVMRWVYTPAVRWAGNPGFFVTSFVGFLLIAVGAAFLASGGRPRGQTTVVAGAATLSLLPSFATWELYVIGVNDVVPVALMVWALAVRLRGHAVLAGVVLAASIGAKLMPGALVALPLVFAGPRPGRTLAALVGTAVVIYLPSLIEAPREVVASLLIFNAARPPDSTSVLALAPLWLATLAGWASLLAVAAVGVGATRALGRPAIRPAALATVAAICLVVAFAGSPAVHRNYLFWLTPLVAAAVAARVWPAPEPQGSYLGS